MMEHSAPAGQGHDSQRAGMAGHGCEEGLKSGLFTLPFGMVLFLSTAGMTLLNMGLSELGTPPEILWPLLVAMPLAVVAGTLRMRPASAGLRGEGRADGEDGRG